MPLSWFRILLLLVFELVVSLTLPAQKFSPGIPITPTVNQSPGKVSGFFSEPGSPEVSQQNYSPPTVSAPVIAENYSQPPVSVVYKYQPEPQRPVYVQTSSPVYSSSQYPAQTAPVYVYAGGPPSTQSSTRFGNTYYSPSSPYYSNTASNFYPTSPSISSVVANGLGLGGSSSLNSGVQTLGALGALGALGTLGAGALLLG